MMLSEFIEMNVIWTWLGQVEDSHNTGADEYASLRARFDRVAATVPESEHPRLIGEIESDPGYARRYMAEIVGRDHKVGYEVRYFGPHTRFVPTLTVYASGRAMRHAKRQSKPTVYAGPTRGAHGRRAA